MVYISHSLLQIYRTVTEQATINFDPVSCYVQQVLHGIVKISAYAFHL